jgi:putative ABC transport system ATP-binding protein
VSLRAPDLDVQGLQVRFSNGPDALTALTIDELRVGSGALLTVTGPSGSGKSTFLYAIGGLLRPARGRIVWGDSDILK